MNFLKYLMVGLLALPLLSTAESVENEQSDTVQKIETISQTQNSSFRASIEPVFSKGSYSEKLDAFELFKQQPTEVAEPLLTAISKKTLFYKKSDNTLHRIVSVGEGFELSSLDSDGRFLHAQTLDSKSGYKKVRTNNKLRSEAKHLIATINLSSDSSDTRLNAVRRLLKNVKDDTADILREAKVNESHPKVLELMNVGLAVHGLNDDATASDAIKVLSNSIDPVALNALKNFNEDTNDEALKSQSSDAIKRIEGKHKFYKGAETLYFGLSLGSVLVLAGIGLAITFGVMGVINMAHGELIMLGAYTTYVVQQLMPNSIGASIIVAIPCAFMVSACVGILMERTVIRHLYGRPLETLLATFGLSLILQQAARSIFTPLNKTVITPDWMSGSFTINSVLSLTWNRFYVIIFCALVFIALWYVMKNTRLGLHVRAVSQNRAMARAMGVRSTRVDVLTFGLGSGVAGVAGVALSLLTNVGPKLGQDYIIDSFMVVVFGGVGNLLGTLYAGLSLGVLNKIMEPWAGAMLAKIIILVFIILFIQKRPQGLFPQKGRAAQD